MVVTRVGAGAGAGAGAATAAGAGATRVADERVGCVLVLPSDPATITWRRTITIVSGVAGGAMVVEGAVASAAAASGSGMVAVSAELRSAPAPISATRSSVPAKAAAPMNRRVAAAA